MDKKFVENFVVVLNDIRSAYNVGSILRTADGIGVGKVYFCGYTPTPALPGQPYKTQAQKMLGKTALGAEQNVTWEKRVDACSLLDELKEKKFTLVALEQAENSVNYKIFSPPRPLVLVLGNEIEGVKKEILKKCETVLEIPMFGLKNSLNVAVAFGIAGYEIRSRIKL